MKQQFCLSLGCQMALTMCLLQIQYYFGLVKQNLYNAKHFWKRSRCKTQNLIVKSHKQLDSSAENLTTSITLESLTTYT